MKRVRLRASEWLLLAYFLYVAALVPFFKDRPLLHSQPFLNFALAAAVIYALALGETTRFSKAVSMIRDWVPMALTLLAFREMELFRPDQYSTVLESSWIPWDDVLLNRWKLKALVESFGVLAPLFLELAYLLVYAVGTYCIVVLWVKNLRSRVDRFYIVLLAGTLLSYALFPYFPSRPPRLVFPDMDMPSSQNFFRKVNLFLLGRATIHSAVFPSAHVSSAFAAAWGMFLVLLRPKRIAWGLLLYAIFVAIATVYGRYHYATDALAGFGVSLIAAAIAWGLRFLPEPVTGADTET